MGRDARFNQKGFRSLPGGMGNVPIIGQTPPVSPPLTGDWYGRPLLVGDLVELHTPNQQPFRVAQIDEVTDQKGGAMLDITFIAEVKFRAARGVRNIEFVRVVSLAEQQQIQQAIEAEQNRGKTLVTHPDESPLADAPAATPEHPDGFKAPEGDPT